MPYLNRIIEAAIKATVPLPLALVLLIAIAGVVGICYLALACWKAHHRRKIRRRLIDFGPSIRNAEDDKRQADIHRAGVPIRSTAEQVPVLLDPLYKCICGVWHELLPNTPAGTRCSSCQRTLPIYLSAQQRTRRQSPTAPQAYAPPSGTTTVSARETVTCDVCRTVNQLPIMDVDKRYCSRCGMFLPLRPEEDPMERNR